MGKRVEIAERLKQLGVDPVEGMARIATQAERNGNHTLAAKVYSELLQYTAPKLKAIEHSIAPSTMEFLDRQQRVARILQLQNQLKDTLLNPALEPITDAEFTEIGLENKPDSG